MSTSPELPSYEEATTGGLLQDRTPRLRLKDVVELWMKHKESGLDGGIHPALNTAAPHVKQDAQTSLWTAVDDDLIIGSEASGDESVSAKDPDRHKWKDEEDTEDPCFKELFQNVQKDEEDFRAAVEVFEREAKAKYKFGIDFAKAHSIEDVMAAVKAAKDQYDASENKGILGPFRKALRKIGEHQKTYTNYVNLAPSQSTYFSLVCGGVVLLIEAAGRLREVNAEIIETLANIPLFVDKSQRLLAAYPKSSSLRTFSIDLYVAVLQALGHVLHYYRQRTFPKAFKVIIKQSSFQQTLFDKVAFMRRCDEAISRERDLCDAETGVDTNRTARKTEKISKAVYEKQGETHEEVVKLRNETVKWRRVAEKNAEALNAIAQQFRANPHLAMFSSVALPEKIQFSTSNQQLVETDSSTENAQLARKQFVKQSKYQLRTTRTDRQENLSQIMSFTQTDQCRAVHIMQSAIVQNWLTTPYSSALLINGNMSKHNLRTPISFVSAKLADALHRSRKSGLKSTVINLHFFCGEHASWRQDPDNGPAAVWNSLLTQLLLQHDGFHYADIKKLSKLDPDNVKLLGRMFARLLRQLSAEHMVFCVIDSISVYDDERREEAELLVGKLVDLAQESDPRVACIFKLLLTAPTRLRLDAARDLDAREEVLQVPETLPRGDGFSEMKWDLGVGADIASLQLT